MDNVREDWLTLDHVPVPDIEDVRKRFRLFVSRSEKQWTASDGLSYMDGLSTDNHIVFVSHGMYKTFAHFVGSNGKGDALVTVHHSTQVTSVPPHLVISM